MHQALEEYAQSACIDWDTNFIWIQNTSLLKVIEHNQNCQFYQVMLVDFQIVKLSCEFINARYFPILQGTYLKPKYSPKMAHVLSKNIDIFVNNKRVQFPIKSAIIKDMSEQYDIIHAYELNRDYEAVSELSDKRYPEMPFMWE